jgi:predicted nucleic acid-binding protein
MRIAITDANIFIDLFEIGWQNHLFEVGLEIVTTREVFNELYEEQQKMLSVWVGNGALRILDIMVSEHDRVNAVANTKKLSFTDKTVLFVAQRDSLTVLTGDKRVRVTAQQLGLSTHGILWVFDRFLEFDIVDGEQAATVLENLIRVNTHLPMEECWKRIEQWRE